MNVKIRIKTPERDLEKIMAIAIRTMPKETRRFVERPLSWSRRSFSRQVRLDEEKRSILAMISPIARGIIISM
jgi:hypothetical protein